MGPKGGKNVMIIIRQTYQHQWLWWACNRRECFVTILVITAKCTRQKWGKEPKKSLGMSVQTIKNTEAFFFFPSSRVWHRIKCPVFDGFRCTGCTERSYLGANKKCIFSLWLWCLQVQYSDNLLWSSLCRKDALMNLQGKVSWHTVWVLLGEWIKSVSDRVRRLSVIFSEFSTKCSKYLFQTPRVKPLRRNY